VAIIDIVLTGLPESSKVFQPEVLDNRFHEKADVRRV